MCQFEWWLLTIHGKYSRLHVCFDRVNNGLTHKNNKQINGPNLYPHSRCDDAHHKLRGKLATY